MLYAFLSRKKEVRVVWENILLSLAGVSTGSWRDGFDFAGVVHVGEVRLLLLS